MWRSSSRMVYWKEDRDNTGLTAAAAAGGATNKREILASATCGCCISAESRSSALLLAGTCLHLLAGIYWRLLYCSVACLLELARSNNRSNCVSAHATPHLLESRNMLICLLAHRKKAWSLSTIKVCMLVYSLLVVLSVFSTDVNLLHSDLYLFTYRCYI